MRICSPITGPRLFAALLLGLLACSADRSFNAPHLAPLWPVSDDGQTPRDRSKRHLGLAGPFRIDQLEPCSPRAARRVVGSGWLNPDEMVELTILGKSSRPANARLQNDLLKGIIDAAAEPLRKGGDPHVGSRALCIGLYEFGGRTARSYPEGYIAVDKRIIEWMYSLPDDKRNMVALDQVLLHEFAHQLQYWWGNPFSSDRTRRRSELVADCVAASLLRLRWKDLSFGRGYLESGPLAAAEEAGELVFEDADHHGSADERKTAVLFGIEVDREPVGATGVTSGHALLERCGQFIVHRDQQYGLDWPSYERFKASHWGKAQ
jgi:hypothetical protein